jgi:hypothetical protein
MSETQTLAEQTHAPGGCCDSHAPHWVRAASIAGLLVQSTIVWAFAGMIGGFAGLVAGILSVTESEEK